MGKLFTELPQQQQDTISGGVTKVPGDPFYPPPNSYGNAAITNSPASSKSRAIELNEGEGFYYVTVETPPFK